MKRKTKGNWNNESKLLHLLVGLDVISYDEYIKFFVKRYKSKGTGQDGKNKKHVLK